MNNTTQSSKGDDTNNAVTAAAGGGVQVRVNYHRRKRASTALVTSRILKTGLCLAFGYAAVSQVFFMKQWANQNPRSNSINDDDTPHDFYWQEGDAPEKIMKPKEVKFFEGFTVPIKIVVPTTAPKKEPSPQKHQESNHHKDKNVNDEEDSDDADNVHVTKPTGAIQDEGEEEESNEDKVLLAKKKKKKKDKKKQQKKSKKKLPLHQFQVSSDISHFLPPSSSNNNNKNQKKKNNNKSQSNEEEKEEQDASKNGEPRELQHTNEEEEPEEEQGASKKAETRELNQTNEEEAFEEEQGASKKGDSRELNPNSDLAFEEEESEEEQHASKKGEPRDWSQTNDTAFEEEESEEEEPDASKKGEPRELQDTNDDAASQLLSRMASNINKNTNPQEEAVSQNNSSQLVLIPGEDVEFLDKFSDSWLIDKKNFMAIDISRIDYVEQACFQIMIRRHARMTLDWTDFMVEHLSKWWSELNVLFDMDNRMFEHMIHNIFHPYIVRHTDQLKDMLLQRKNNMAMEQVEDAKSPLHPTLAMIAYQTYESVFREREASLSPFSMAATLVSLLQVGFGRIVIVGYEEGDRKHAQKALELIATRIPGSKLVDQGAVMAATNTTTTNSSTTNDDHHHSATLTMTVGHTEIAYVRIPSETWVKTKSYKVNMPRGALWGVREAIKGNLTRSLHNASAEDWLGTTYDRKYWKYFYLTEPDTILHTKRHLLPLIRDGLDQGTMYMPHRLQPLPHEYNLPPAKEDHEGANENKKAEVSRGNKYLSTRYQGRYIPGDIHPFSNITFLDPWNNQEDHCCDAGKLWPGRSEEFGEKQIPCGNWWWACGFGKTEDVRNFTADEIREKHKRLLPYPLMSLDSGTGIVFGPAEQGRRCFPSKEPCSLPTEEKGTDQGR